MIASTAELATVSPKLGPISSTFGFSLPEPVVEDLVDGVDVDALLGGDLDDVVAQRRVL